MLVSGDSTNVTVYAQLLLIAGGDATALTIADFDLTYTRSGATPAAKVDAIALAAANSNHADNRGIEVDPTDAPGLYRFDFPDAAFADGVPEVRLTIKHTSCITESIKVEIDAIAPPVWDRVLTGATHNIPTSAGRRLRGIQEFQGYEGGAVWVDTVNGTAGTVAYENGTVENPVDSIADANTIAAALGFSHFRIMAGSTITLATTQQNQVFIGVNWTLNLNGQDIAGSMFHGAAVSGVAAGTGTTQMFRTCTLNAVSHIKNTHCIECAIAATQTLIEAGDIFFNGCYSAIAGTATWTFDFGSAIGSSNLNMRHYSGGIQLENMGDTGTDTASIEGFGQIIEGTCTGGTIATRGHFTTSGITNISLNNDGARFDAVQLVDDLWDEVLTGGTHNVTNSAGKIVRTLREVGVYEGGQVWLDSSNGVAGTTTYENGGVNSPSDNIADATTLATAAGLNRFQIAPGSSFILAQAYSNWIFNAEGHWTLALGGQQLDDVTIYFADVSGIATSTNNPHFEECGMGVVTLPPCHLKKCSFLNTITLGAAGTYMFETCISGVAGTGAPIIDFGAAIGNNDVNVRRYSGGLDVRNMGQVGTDNMSLEGTGQLIINANCTGGTIVIRGDFQVTDNSGGAVTLVYDDNSTKIASFTADMLSAGDIDGYSVEETLKLVLSACAGIVAGAATTTITIRAADDSKTRITATVDSDGNRSVVTLDATG